MWQALYRAFNNFWNPTPELRAATALPFRERIKQLGEWSYWRASFRWPVIWRRFVVLWSFFLVVKILLFAVIGFQTVALEYQAQARAKIQAQTPRWDDLIPVSPDELAVVGQAKIGSPAARLAVGMTEQQVLHIMKAGGKSYWGFELLTCGEKSPPAWTCKRMRFQPAFFSSDADEVQVWFEQIAVDEWRVHSWAEVPVVDPDR